MNNSLLYIPRRKVLSGLALGAAFFTTRGAFADALLQTPPQTEGPFYPDKLPLDTDNDLLRLNDNLTPAIGEVTWLSGRILDQRGEPVRNATVEIWQCDATGVYLHSKSGGDKSKRDANFQGFGRFVTGSSGEYLFRTIKPVPYPGRTPHVHFAIKWKGEKKFVTQCYVQGEPLNAKDGPLQSIRDLKQRESIIVPFTPLPGTHAGELAAKFDIVLGFTPEV